MNVSAKTGEGIDDLLNMIGIVSEMLELKAPRNGLAKAVVIESRLSRQKGPIATLLVKVGTLKLGDFFVVGAVSGKVRALFNDFFLDNTNLISGSDNSCNKCWYVPEAWQIQKNVLAPNLLVFHALVDFVKSFL